MKIVYSTMQSMHKVKGGLREGHLDFQRSRPGCLGLGMPAKLPLIEKPLHPQPVHPVGPPLIQFGKMCNKKIQKYGTVNEKIGRDRSNTLFVKYSKLSLYSQWVSCLPK